MIRVWVDGSCRPNPGKGGIGIVFEGDKMSYTISEKCPGNRLFSNECEYLAFNWALSEILGYGFNNEEIEVLSDSEMLVLQMLGEKEVDKGGKYVSVYLEAKELIKHFPNLTIEHIPREQNAEANLLASGAIRVWH